MSDTALLTDIVKRLVRIEKTLRPTTANWLTEEEAMKLTDLSRCALWRKRKAGVFRWSSATGRKVKYLAKDVEAYLNDNSTL